MKLKKLLLASVLAALVLGVIGALAVWAQQAWLIPSLGSAILVQTIEAEQPTAGGYSMFVGQLLGVAAGVIAVYVTAGYLAPHFATGQPLVWSRVAATALAILLVTAFQLAASAKSPAGGTIAVLLAIGDEPLTWHAIGLLVVGIVLVTALGEAARRAVLRATNPAATGPRPAAHSS